MIIPSIATCIGVLVSPTIGTGSCISIRTSMRSSSGTNINTRISVRVVVLIATAVLSVAVIAIFLLGSGH